MSKPGFRLEGQGSLSENLQDEQKLARERLLEAEETAHAKVLSQEKTQ